MAIRRVIKTKKGIYSSFCKAVKIDGAINKVHNIALRVNTPQMVDKSKIFASVTSNGVTFTNNGDGTITINGTATADTYKIYLTIPLPSNDKVLIRGCPKGGTSKTYFIGSNKGGPTIDYGGGVITDLSTQGTGSVLQYIMIKKGCVADNLIFRPETINLTQAFGEGNEPNSVEEAEAKLKDYIPYQYL